MGDLIGVWIVGTVIWTIASAAIYDINHTTFKENKDKSYSNREGGTIRTRNWTLVGGVALLATPIWPVALPLGLVAFVIYFLAFGVRRFVQNLISIWKWEGK